MSVDVLAVGAHPDDADLGVGGLLSKLAGLGYRTAILDLTEGELASRGSVEERHKEAHEAARILGVFARENAGIPDGEIANTTQHQHQVAFFLRKFRPTVLLAPMAPDRHPDHTEAHVLIRDANYFAGLHKIDTGQEPYRAPNLYYYHAYSDAAIPPAMVLDITEHFETKLRALNAYVSQFHNPGYNGPETFVSSKHFWDNVRTRAAYWGGRVGVAYGEALYADLPLALNLPPGLHSPGARSDRDPGTSL